MTRGLRRVVVEVGGTTSGGCAAAAAGGAGQIWALPAPWLVRVVVRTAARGADVRASVVLRSG